ncbi:hypothetical protein [Amnibacterium sp.]|uniref:hypothetical protein n=1 Tax=Amnibacterium sp. TaxID=1872496 RepID=UPI002627D1AC|nr:hypothetical protein [Amnibacterium sp.]MCU1474426.1 hypothetical protein [Amnibacterium sp.]
MFPSSSLHTDFARQVQVDRRASLRVERSTPGERRARFAALLAVIARPFRRPASLAPAVDVDRSAAA